MTELLLHIRLRFAFAACETFSIKTLDSQFGNSFFISGDDPFPMHLASVDIWANKICWLGYDGLP